jgi:cell division protein FtsB
MLLSGRDLLRMKMSLGRIAVVVIALATTAYGIAEFRAPNGYKGFVEKREQVQRLEVENQRLRGDIERLEKRVKNLADDPSTQEQEIRKRYGLLKEGETVYLIQDKKKAEPQQ